MSAQIAMRAGVQRLCRATSSGSTAAGGGGSARSVAAVEEAARISGAGRLRAMLDTTGRMAIPAVVSGAVLVAVTAVRELTVSILLIAPGTTTIGVQLFNLQQSGNYNQASALALMFAVIGIVALALTIRNPERSAK